MMVKAGDRERGKQGLLACISAWGGCVTPIALRVSQPSSVDPSEPWTQA